MTPEHAIRKLLMAESNITDVVSTRFGPWAAAQSWSLPYGVYMRISAVHSNHMTAMGGVVVARIQVDWCDEDYDRLMTTADTARDALSGYTGTVTDGADSLVVRLLRLETDAIGMEQPTAGSDEGVWRMTQDYVIAYPESVPTFT